MIQLIEQYMKVVLQSLISMFLDLPHTSILFYPRLFKDITLCKSFVICLVLYVVLYLWGSAVRRVNLGSTSTRHCSLARTF